MHSVWKSFKMSYFKFFTNLIFGAKIRMRVDKANKIARSARGCVTNLNKKVPDFPTL